MNTFDLKLFCSERILSELILVSINQYFSAYQLKDIHGEDLKLAFKDQQPSTSITSSIQVSVNHQQAPEVYEIECHWKVFRENSIQLEILSCKGKSSAVEDALKKAVSLLEIKAPVLTGAVMSQYSIMARKGTLILGSAALSSANTEAEAAMDLSGIGCWISSGLLESNTLELLGRRTHPASNGSRIAKASEKIAMPFLFKSPSIRDNTLNLDLLVNGGISRANGKVTHEKFTLDGTLSLKFDTLGNQLFMKPKKVSVKNLQSKADDKAVILDNLQARVESLVTDFWTPPVFTAMINGGSVVQLDFSQAKVDLERHGLIWMANSKAVVNPVAGRTPVVSSRIDLFKKGSLPSLKDILYEGAKKGDSFDGGVYTFGLYEPQGRGVITLLEDRKLAVEGTYNIDQRYGDQHIKGTGVFNASLQWDEGAQKWKGQAKIQGTWNEGGDVFLDFIEDDHYSTFVGTAPGGKDGYLVTAQTWRESKYMYCYVSIEPEIATLPSFYIEHIIS
jgi:hypothetical protein